jgi:hypothetical protein
MMMRRVFLCVCLLLAVASSGWSQDLDGLAAPDLKDSRNLKLAGGLSEIVSVWRKARTGALPLDAARKEIESIVRREGLPEVPGKVEVWITFQDEARIDVSRLESLGIVEDDHFAIVENQVQAMAPLESLEALAALPEVLSLSLPPTGHPDVLSEGFSRVNAQNYTSAGFRGAGIKIAVLDLGFSGYSSRLGSELPSSVTVKSFYNSTSGNGDITGGGEIHGTACAEIVYDMAQDATMYLVNYKTQAEMTAAVQYLIGQGVHVISHSVGWFNTSFYDGGGPISSIVTDAKNHGILWVNSSGNFARSHWEGFFADSDADKFNEFSSGDETINVSVNAGDTISAYLTWNDWTLSTNDYDLYLYFGSPLQEVAKSNGFQTGTQNPTEAIVYTAPQGGTYHIAIKRPFAVNLLKLELLVARQDLSEYANAATSLADPAPSSSSFTVGAMHHASSTIELFSSRGPTTGGVTKPDITAPDGVSTSTYGTGGFYGTSAAAPHVAGAAGEVWSENLSRSASQVQSILQSAATDYGSSGKDNTYGYGLLNLPSLLQANWVTPPPASITAGQNFTVSWSLTGGSANHVNVHWSPNDPTASGCCLGAVNTTESSTTSPNSSPLTMTAPTLLANGTPITSPTLVKYVVHVLNSSTGAFDYSSVVSVTVQPPSCSFTLSPTSQSFGSGGGSGSFSVTTQSGCSWSASPSASWITITSGSGSGSGTVSYNVSANSGTGSRSGTITAGGQTFSISQAGLSCSYSLSPTSQSFGSGSGSGSFSVTTQSGCSWSASTASSWISITSGSGSGNGTVSFNVSSNSSASSRSETINVAGQTFTVSQSGTAAAATGARAADFDGDGTADWIIYRHGAWLYFGPCGHPLTQQGPALSTSCSACVVKVCNQDSFCCNNEWDGFCVSEAASLCP